MRTNRLCVLAVAAGLVLTTGASALVHETNSAITPFRDPSLDIATAYQQASELSAADNAAAIDALAALGVAPTRAFLDLRSNRWGTLMPSHPLIPGAGAGNELQWSSLGYSAPGDNNELEAAAWKAFVDYLSSHHASLRIDADEVTPRGHVTVHGDGQLVQIFAPRIHQGIPVRDSALTAVINNGNLILFGALKWGDVTTSIVPSVSAEQAFSTVSGQLKQSLVYSRRAAYLSLIPTANGSQLGDVELGSGYGYRLAWVVSPKIANETGRWEALVDAHSGELIGLQDLNQYATRRQVQGGVLPIANDGIVPDGVEQAGWPMPWADLEVGGETFFTDGGGNLPFCADGTVTTTLSGQFMNMFDNCGALSESTSGQILDLGTSGGTDCTVPGGASPGNTHASRSGFFEMNQVQAQARGQLANNLWVRDQLTSNMNINGTCNAFWDGSTVNFYLSGGGCSNTGELAGVFDHEWGHGMDANDAVPAISNPGEGIADLYAALRLNTSCMGRSFQGGNCNGYGDACTDCSGVRDIDWANRTSGLPHDVTSAAPTGIDALCGSGNGTPCGGSTHCEGAVYAEAVWDLFNRDLPTAGFDHVTSIELAARLTYSGGGNVGNWFQCVADFAGCNADGGYLNYLAADDDNGDLSDGTPHMAEIFAAFDRHEIACNAPVVQNGGCAAGPATAPAINSVTGIDKGAVIDFNASPGATHYDVFRTDGVFGCDQGKIKVGSFVPPPAETGGFIFADSGLQNGREYFYTVIAVGSSDACTSPAATCTAVTPVAGANLALNSAAASVAINIGDGDIFLDNCEEATISVDVNSIGTGAQSNVRIVSATPISHPSTVVTTVLPQLLDTSMGSCQTVTAAINFQAQGLAFDDTFEMEIGVTSDELFPVIKTGVVRVKFTESSLQTVASQTFTFEADNDDWNVQQGTFSRESAGGGGNGTTFYQQSSAFLDGQCDVIRSPLMVTSPSSTLSLFNNFDIEPMSAGTWYDRGNIGVLDASENRTLLTPDGGRLYNADSGGPGTYGGCNEPEEGWADSMPSWAESTWSASAFGGVAPAGLSQLEVIYSTDPAANGDGFRFDEVTVTDIELQIADSETDVCEAPIFLFSDGFEAGDTGAWGSVVQ